MSTPFSEQDQQFLKAVGISAEPTVNETREALAQLDGTVTLLEKFGIPVTRENYLRLSFQSPLSGTANCRLSGEK
jgi:hypothetical protein